MLAILYKTNILAKHSIEFTTIRFITNFFDVWLHWVTVECIICRFIMEKIDFVVVGAEGVVESGGIINKVGT